MLTQKFIGKTCPFCQFPLKADSEAVECSSCKVPHHRECWEQNGGCTTFGCRGLSSDRPSSYQSRRDVIEIDLGEAEESSVESKLPKSFTSYGMENAILPFYRRFIGFRTLTPWKTFVGGAFYLVSFIAPIILYILYVDILVNLGEVFARFLAITLAIYLSIFLASSIMENRKYGIYLTIFLVYIAISAGIIYYSFLYSYTFDIWSFLWGFFIFALIDSLWVGSWGFGLACILFGIINKKSAGFILGMLVCAGVAFLLSFLFLYLLEAEGLLY